MECSERAGKLINRKTGTFYTKAIPIFFSQLPKTFFWARPKSFAVNIGAILVFSKGFLRSPSWTLTFQPMIFWSKIALVLWDHLQLCWKLVRMQYSWYLSALKIWAPAVHSTRCYADLYFLVDWHLRMLIEWCVMHADILHRVASYQSINILRSRPAKNIIPHNFLQRGFLALRFWEHLDITSTAFWEVFSTIERDLTTLE